jgi:UDP-N-acetyl-D-mannosaminuronate dehydrogenase
VFGTVEALRSRGAEPLVHDPLFSDAELAGFGFAAYHLGEPADFVVVQADHAEYAKLTPADVPGVRALLDGRQVTDPAAWADVVRIVIGAPVARP